MGFYEGLGVRPVINAWGTVTVAGGSLMDPRVLEAMTDASRSFVDMEELLRAAEERIAGVVGVDAVCITSGAAAGLAVSAAACLAGARLPDVLRLPDASELANEVLVLKAHRIRYDQAVLLSGAVFREIGVTSAADVEQVRAAVGPRTAMFLWVAEAAGMRGSVPLAAVVQALAGSGVPIVVDAAAELPPRTNLTAFLDAGADLVVFSGGKEIRGPQSSGFIAGRRELVAACRANAFPRYGVGRAMKVDKETVAGLVTAVELFAARDEDAVRAGWDRTVERIVDAVRLGGRADVRRGLPVEPGVQPPDIPRVYVRPHRGTAEQVREQLRRGEPAVLVSTSGDEIVLNPQCLEDAELPALIAALIAALAGGIGGSGGRDRR